MFHIDPPSLSGNTQEQVNQLRSFLYRLTEELNLYLNSEGAITAPSSISSSNPSANETEKMLLLLKNSLSSSISSLTSSVNKNNTLLSSLISSLGFSETGGILTDTTIKAKDKIVITKEGQEDIELTYEKIKELLSLLEQA